MNYNLDHEHLQTDDSIDIDFGVILKGMEGTDLWNDFDEEITAYNASTPAFIRQHDLDHVPGSPFDV